MVNMVVISYRPVEGLLSVGSDIHWLNRRLQQISQTPYFQAESDPPPRSRRLQIMADTRGSHLIRYLLATLSVNTQYK